MERLTAKEYRDFEQAFIKKCDEYRTKIKNLFLDTNLSNEEFIKNLVCLKEEYREYTTEFEDKYYASINEEYLEAYDGGDVNAKKLCEEAKKYIGTRVIYSDDKNSIGILKDIVAMVDGYYYVIEISDTSTKYRYCSCVGEIKIV